MRLPILGLCVLGACLMTSCGGGAGGTGTGNEPPSALLSPGSLTFGMALIGTTSQPLTTTLTNSGPGDLNIVSISASAGFTQTNNCGATLAAASNCTISVSFAPVAGQNGATMGILSVADNAVNSPQRATLAGTAILSGTGCSLKGQECGGPLPPCCSGTVCNVVTGACQ